MTRIFRSTTTLTAALSMLAPNFVSAETVLTQGEAREMQQRTAEDQPLLAAALENEIAAGLTVDQLGCMDGAPRPCADDVALMSPMGLAVWSSEEGDIVLAEQAEQDPAVASAIAAGIMTDPAPRVMAEAETTAVLPLPEDAGTAAPVEADLAAQLEAAEPTVADAGVQEEPPAPSEPQADAAPAAEEPAAEEVAAETGAEEPAAVAEAPAEEASAEAAAAGDAGSADAPAEDVTAADASAAGTDDVDALAAALAEGEEPVAPQAEASQAADAEASDPAAAADAAPVSSAEVTPEAASSEAQPEAAPAEAAAADNSPADEAQAAAAPEVAIDGSTAAAPTADELAAALGEADAPAVTPEIETNAAAPADPLQAVTAATGQAEPPRPVEVTADEAQALTEALALVETQSDAGASTRADAEAQTQQTQAAEQPAPEAPSETQTAQATAAADSDESDSTDAASIAAAAGTLGPLVAALTAPAQLGENASTVVVTEESARSSSEDFLTSLAQAVAAAQNQTAATGQQAAASTSAAGGSTQTQPTAQAQAAPAQQASRDDDDDDDTLRNLLIAGLGAYAVGTILANQNRVALNTGDRVVVEAPDGSQQVFRDDNALLLTPGAQVTTENFSDGSSRSIVTRQDGSRVVTIRDAQLRVLRRTLIGPDGTVTELINDAAPVAPVEVAALPPAARPVVISPSQVTPEELARALRQEAAVDRRFSLSQVRNIAEVRNLVAPISIDTITFDTASAAIRPSQAQQLATLGQTIAGMVRQNPGEVFLIEGYTDTVGGEEMNLALSDRRAESLALALTEYFDVPPENMVVQGYGERFLKVPQEGDIRENRRVAVRRITGLLQN